MSEFGGDGYSLEAIAGAVMTLFAGWLGKLHIDVRAQEKELGSHKAETLSREEFQRNMDAHKTDLLRNREQIEASMATQFSLVHRVLERLENRLDR